MKLLFSITVLLFSLQFITNFSSSDAIKFWDYSRISYCSPSNIEIVNCGKKCEDYKLDLQDITVIENMLKGLLSYVAYSNEELSLVLVFRGTTNIQNWFENFSAIQLDYEKCSECKVHTGFYENYKTLEPQIQVTLEKLSTKHNTKRLIITGHSLGGAMATIATGELHENYLIHKFYTYGSPRVGNKEYAVWLNLLPIASKYRVTNNGDMVYRVPQPKLGYHHVDQEIWYYKSKALDYKICDKGEDPKCSNSVLLPSILDHLEYMNRHWKQYDDDYDFIKCQNLFDIEETKQYFQKFSDEVQSIFQKKFQFF